MAGDARRGALHQDLDREDAARGDPAGHRGDARGGPRLPGGDRPDGRREAGRWHPLLQGRDQAPGHGQRDRRQRLARPGLVPLRCVDPAKRPADAAHQDADRPLLRSRLLHPGLIMTFEFEYSPAPEARSVVDIRPSYGLFVDGEFVDGHGRAFKTISPSTEEVLAELAEADQADVDAAVKAARRAYTRVWSKMSGSERSKYLFRIARIIQERAREFAV